MDQKIKKIAVVGGGGRTGRYLVDHLLERGFRIKLLLRNRESAEQLHLKHSLIEIVKGDVLDYQKVKLLLEDCQAVISTVGQRKDEPLVASHATLNILGAMQENTKVNCKRYILVAGINVDTPFDVKGPDTSQATEWMKLNFSSIHEDRQKAYQILEKSDADWTLVRVPFIEFGGSRGRVKSSLTDAPGQKISAVDIATFLVSQLDETLFIRKAPFIANVS